MIKETCSCGASFEAEYPRQYENEIVVSNIEHALEEWRKRHDACLSLLQVVGTHEGKPLFGKVLI